MTKLVAIAEGDSGTIVSRTAKKFWAKAAVWVERGDRPDPKIELIVEQDGTWRLCAVHWTEENGRPRVEDRILAGGTWDEKEGFKLGG